MNNKNEYYTNVAVLGNHILYRGIKNGKRIKERIPYKPTLYFKSKEVSTPYSVGWKNLDDEIVLDHKFSSIKEAKDFSERYKDVDGMTIYGMNRFEYAFISDQFYNKDVPWNIDDIRIGTIDIEVASENGFPHPEKASEEVTAITLKIDGKFHVWGCGFFKNADPLVKYYHCQDEPALIRSFLNFWEENCPDIITGWNINGFDIPYLINRITNLFDEKESLRLSPWKKIGTRSYTIMGRENVAYDIVGVSALDYLQLYKKFAKEGTTRDSYKLNNIAHIEIKEKKIDYSEYDTLHLLYKLNYQKFIEYNIHDVRLVEKLEERLKLIRQCIFVAYDARVNYADVFMQVRLWDCIIYNHLRQKNIVIPPLHISEKMAAYEGAYVKDPLIGKHQWVVSGDLDSLYPHLQMEFNLSPDTVVDVEDWDPWMHEISKQVNVETLLAKKLDLSPLKSKKLTITPNGQFFRIDKLGFMPEILIHKYDTRAAFKGKMLDAKKEKEKAIVAAIIAQLEKDISSYDNIQNGLKVGLNSCYGAAGSKYFRYYDLRIAEAVTYTGKLAIQWIQARVNDYVNKIMKTKGVDYIIAADTDSLYINFGPLVNQLFTEKQQNDEPLKIVNFLDKVWKEKIQKVINDACEELAEYTNAYANKMRMKRESICDKALWTAKKRYILQIWDKEGVRYKEPKIDVTGLEMVKSSTPSACREKLEKAMPIIMNQTEMELREFVEQFRTEFEQVPIEDIAFPRGVNGLEQYKDALKSVPIHVKGSLLYNQMILANNLNGKYPLIQEGDKIRFIYLKEPNPIKSYVVAFSLRLPPEFNLAKYIDYDIQFDKSFKEPLKIILDAIGWNLEQVSSLESFF